MLAGCNNYSITREPHHSAHIWDMDHLPTRSPLMLVMPNGEIYHRLMPNQMNIKGNGLDSN